MIYYLHEKLLMLLPGNTYHIYNRANGFENLFREEKNYYFFLGKLKEHVSPVADIIAWCLLANHFHLMIRVKLKEETDMISSEKEIQKPEASTHQHQSDFQNLTGVDVSKRLSNCFNAYTKAYNKVYARNGSLFQRPFKQKQVTHQRYFAQLMLYIHNNATRHGFVSHFYDWPHSSWFQYQTDKINLPYAEEYYKIITPEIRDKVFEWFGSKEAFFKAHNEIPHIISSFE
jgi:REP element-mobilizing transposase RayT